MRKEAAQMTMKRLEWAVLCNKTDIMWNWVRDTDTSENWSKSLMERKKD